MKGTSVMNSLTRKAATYLRRNSSTFLTIIGSAGVVATAVTAAQATPKALKLLDAAAKEKGEELTKVEKILTAAPAYIPSVAIGASTIACIFGANVLNKRQQASLASAYAMVDASYKQYREKVKEIFAEEGHNRVMEDIVEDKYKESDISVSKGKQLCYDAYSGRYFESTLEDVIAAEYHFNRNFTLRGGAPVNEFYDFLGIDHIEGGDDIGWGFKFIEGGCYWVDFYNRMTTLEDGLECCIIEMVFEPEVNYDGDYD